MKRGNTPRGLSLIERAILEKQVRETLDAAHRSALSGDDSDEMVNKAGRIFYVVLGAAVRDEMDRDLPDIRIVRGACNAMFEQKGCAVVDSGRRASLKAGLQAAERLLCALDYDSVVKEAFELHLQLRAGHVGWHDFQRLMEKVAA